MKLSAPTLMPEVWLYMWAPTYVKHGCISAEFHQVLAQFTLVLIQHIWKNMHIFKTRWFVKCAQGEVNKAVLKDEYKYVFSIDISEKLSGKKLEVCVCLNCSLNSYQISAPGSSPTDQASQIICPAWSAGNQCPGPSEPKSAASHGTWCQPKDIS